LWALDLTDQPPGDPQLLLSEDSQQGPLALLPGSNTLLYATYEGVVPAPTDGSAPPDIDALNYANNLNVASIMGNPLRLVKSQVILPQQNSLKSNTENRWVMSPQPSPDGHTLVYIVFSNDTEDPFDRHSSLYTVQVNGSGTQLQVSKPELFSPSTSLYVELGPWLDNHILTFYADNSLYAVDMQSKAIATVAHTKGYARIVAVV
jgi:hypothetical protein